MKPCSSRSLCGRGRALLVGLGATAIAACATESSDEVESGEDEIRWEPISTALGDPPNFAQLGNGSTMSVVSRDFGRGAKAGALVELFYPKYAADNLWDSYVGVRSRGVKLRWAHDLKLAGQRMVEDTGLVVSEFTAESFELRIEDVLRPGNDAHLRHVVVKNTGARTLEDVDVAFYAFYTLGNFPAGDRIRFDPASGALVQVDERAKVAVATLADRKPEATHCGYALRPFGAQKDAARAAASDSLSPCTEAHADLTGVNGVLFHRLATIAPGETTDITYAIGLGPDGAHALGEASRALQGGFAARAKEDRDHWAGELARAKTPSRLPADAREVYRRAIVTMLQHRVDNGAIVAASTLTSPVYRFVWPRDGSKTAVDLLDAGFAPEAKSFFEFLETLLSSDGSFAVNYHPDGSGPLFDFGRKGNENDQPGMLPWGVDRVFAATRDRDWARARWPAVRRVAEHLLAISSSGIVAPSRDLWELETGGSWTYANGSAVAGLEASSRLARVVGETADADRYGARASALRDALTKRFVAPGGYFARGLNKNRLDARLEIANLALGRGGFAIFPDADPRIARVGDLVGERLSTAGGGVRRYEGDRYYGGQPWPVAAAWLSLHRLERGDRGSSERLFATMTRQAKATDSLMLGEQFDEDKKIWRSAIPLVWSEAAYVRTALALYDE